MIELTSALVEQLLDINDDDDDVLERSGSPPGEYGQVIPPRESKHGVKRTAPPMLPQHLLQMVLNKEVAAHVSVASEIETSFIRCTVAHSGGQSRRSLTIFHA